MLSVERRNQPEDGAVPMLPWLLPYEAPGLPAPN
jgi:hypothetical protein